MKISYQWLSEFVNLSDTESNKSNKSHYSPEEVAKKLTDLGLEVEEVHSLSKGFDNVVAAKILKKEKHPKADRLSVCTVKWNEKEEPLQIVCGAQNMKEGDMVALSQIGAHLPNGLKIKKGKIRDVESFGMLCSESELGLAEESEGILILPQSVSIGTPMAEILGRNDTVFEISLTPNRGDCLSHHGIAREIAAVMGQTQKVCLPKISNIALKNSPIQTKLEAGEVGPQFWGCAIEGVKVGPSPVWLKNRLESLGVRSINNVVDATNYVMLELGQPMHAYDFDRLEGKTLSIRQARKDEKLLLLDGDEVTLQGGELVIADAKKPVALAGVMGGGNSEVQGQTTRLFLECAEFCPTAVRKAARFFKKHTEAAHRFERGIDPAGLKRALFRLADLIISLAGGKIVGATAALASNRNLQTGIDLKTIKIEQNFFKNFLGMDLDQKKIITALESLSCQVKMSEDYFLVTIPSYRWDLAIPQDCAEEVARFYGYDSIPTTLPSLSTYPVITSSQPLYEEWITLNRAKDIFKGNGFHECLNYSFTSRKWLKRLGFESALPLENPLSEDQEVMSPSLLPGLIEALTYNQRHHFGSEALSTRIFEIRPTYKAQENSSVQARDGVETGVTEEWKCSFVFSGPRCVEGLQKDLEEIDFFDLKGVLETFFEQMGMNGFRFQSVQNSPCPGIFHPGKTAEVYAGSSFAGHVGMIHPALAQTLKVKGAVGLCELSWKPLYALARKGYGSQRFKMWPEFPSVERDFSLLVPQGVTAKEVSEVAVRRGKPIAKVAKIFDVYQGEQVPEGMTSLAVRVIFLSKERSLEEKEVESVTHGIIESWKKDLKVELRG